ncbi:MAG: NFACT RNA binding domain-containing protein [bacterium]|nr:NFACT RNA binding domain-containing protein [bacterium]
MNMKLEKTSIEAAAGVPARVEKIGMLHQHALVVRLAGTPSAYVYCAPDAPLRAVCCTTSSPHSTYPHADWLGAAGAVLEQAALVACRAVPGEQVLELLFSTGWRIAVHFFGRRGNAVLVDEHNLIHAVWRALPCHVVGTPYVRHAAPAEAGDAGMRQLPFDELLSGLQRLELDQTRAELQRQLQARRARLAERLRKIEHDLAEVARAAEYRAQGDLLKAHYHLLKPGMRAVTVLDYTAPTPAERTIALDPRKTPPQNMAWYFKKAAKLERGREVIAARHALTQRELAAHDEQGRALAACADVAALRAVLRPLRPTRQPSPAGQQSQARPATRIRQFTSSDGALIMVGRTAADNDELTVHVARGNDVWLHTRNRPGAHVVVRLERNQELTRRTLLEAAQLCAHFSRTPDGALEDIMYVLRKHVSKPKGAKPGLVHVAGGKNITVRHAARAMKEWIAAQHNEADP